ncbi:MAG: response regulator [Deltaproteobacteria bacterium]|nr:response regulator [Deltaproteobacteria bacterium]
MNPQRPADPEYERLFNAISEAVFIQAQDGMFLDANRAATELFGYPREQLVGASPELLRDPRRTDSEATLRYVERAFEGERQTVEWWGRHQSGDLFPSLITLSPGHWGEHPVVIATFRRLGDRPSTSKEEQAELETDRLRGLGQLAAGVAHDFNNALTAILGYAEAMDRRLDDPEFLRRGLDIIQHAARDAAETVRRIQSFARGTSDERHSTVDLAGLLRGAVEMTRPKWHGEAGARSATYSVDVSGPDSALTSGNAGELREVFVNLIFNAVDAMPRGGPVSIGLRVDVDWVHVSVEDSGVGMDAELLTRIFDPFFTTKGDGGSGLGLSVSRGIIERHAGRLEVESSPGEGTRFEVSLPARGSLEEPLSPEPLEPRSARVLLVDDEALVRHAVTAMLERLGMRVVAVKDGIRALELLEDEPFDLVFTDLSMPTVSGAAVVAAVKERHPAVKVVLATGYADNEEALSAREEADAFLSKPFSLNELMAVLSDLLGS